MATLMTYKNSEGTRRCDGKCHNARRPRCRCICGGRYHGVGNSKAAQELPTKDMLGAAWPAKMGLDVQASLPGLI